MENVNLLRCCVGLNLTLHVSGRGGAGTRGESEVGSAEELACVLNSENVSVQQSGSPLWKWTRSSSPLEWDTLEWDPSFEVVSTFPFRNQLMPPATPLKCRPTGGHLSWCWNQTRSHLLHTSSLSHSNIVSLLWLHQKCKPFISHGCFLDWSDASMWEMFRKWSMWLDERSVCHREANQMSLVPVQLFLRWCTYYKTAATSILASLVVAIYHSS